MRIFLLTLSLFFAALQPANAGAKHDAAELAKTLQGAIVTAYSCQSYIGPAYYFNAKDAAKKIIGLIYEDRNRGIRVVATVERQLKASDAQERLTATFDESGLSSIQRIIVCKQMVKENVDKIELYSAKLGLLKEGN